MRNRARIDSLFNGNPPYTDQEANDNRIDTNVNFLEGTKIIHQARQQFANAFLKPQNFFTVTLRTGPQSKRVEWASIITDELNRILKRSPYYSQVLENQFASVVLHGVGPVVWPRDNDWCPKAKGIEDVIVPTATLVSGENLSYFAIYTYFSVDDLVKIKTSKTRDPAWNLEMLNSAIENLTRQVGATYGNVDWQNYLYPEKIEEDFKQNSGFWGSDAVPVLKAYDFYFYNAEKRAWLRRIIVDPNSGNTGQMQITNEFLFNSGDRSYGETYHQIMHVQFADGAVVPPFRWHSVRSLGYLLYAVCHLQNRLRCKFSDAVFESMLWYFRNVSAGDKERLEKIDLQHMGIIPDGLTWVLPNERNQVNFELVNGELAMNRQLMAEASASYQQDVNDGTQKELTATEVMARVQSSNQLLGSMLTRAYLYQIPQYREISRRFCVLDNPDCKKFRERCMARGVDKAVFDVEEWDIDPERVMGSGNKILEIAQADRLMSVRPLLDPQAQREVVHMFVEANTDDPNLANRLVPMSAKTPSPAMQIATMSWGTLIDGKPVVVADGINQFDYIETMLLLLDSEIQKINQTGGMVDANRIMGLQNVVKNIATHIEMVAGDKDSADRVREYSDSLGQAENFIKAYAQRLQEAAQAQQEQAQQGQPVDPETQAKVQSMLITAESKAKIAESNAVMKQQQKQVAFAQEQERKNAETVAGIKRQALESAVAQSSGTSQSEQ